MTVNIYKKLEMHDIPRPKGDLRPLHRHSLSGRIRVEAFDTQNTTGPALLRSIGEIEMRAQKAKTGNLCDVFRRSIGFRFESHLLLLRLPRLGMISPLTRAYLMARHWAAGFDPINRSAEHAQDGPE